MKANNIAQIILTPSLVCLAFFAAAVLPTHSVSAAGSIGIAPATLERLQLRLGTVYRQEIVISQSDPTEDISVSIEPDIPGANEWVSFEPAREFVIAKGVQRFPMTMVINVPNNADIKPYTGAIRIKTASVAEAADGGVAVVKGARVEVRLVTTDLDFADFVVRSINVSDIVEGSPLSFDLKIENTGTVAISPSKVVAQITSLGGAEIAVLETTNVAKVNTGETKTVAAQFDNDLKAGEYFANLSIYNGDEVLRQEKLVVNVQPNPNPGGASGSDGGVVVAPTTLAAVLLVAVVATLVLVTVLSVTRRRRKTA